MEIRPRPWKLLHKKVINEFYGSGRVETVESINTSILDGSGKIIFDNLENCSTIEHIVKCVNEYEDLKNEIKQSRETIDKMAEYIKGWDIDEDICKNVPDEQCRTFNYDVTCKKCVIRYFKNEQD